MDSAIGTRRKSGIATRLQQKAISEHYGKKQ